MFKEQNKDQQGSLWLVNADIVRTAASVYYDSLNTALSEANFSKKIRKASEPYYNWTEVRGRRGIDPVVYFKMLMVGFFENIGSERGIAARCADSISIRDFLKYELTERTPDHSSLTRIRQRLGQEVYDEAFSILLSVLAKHKLLKGKKLGVDTSVIEANASMRTIINRDTGETYGEYVKRLAKESGIESEDQDAVRGFDRKRKGKKVSNDEWHNPNDDDARIGPTKQGKIKMIHKIEHIVDMDTGAIVDLDVLPGDQSDSEDLAEHIWDAENRINKALGKPQDEATATAMVADKGYFAIDELSRLQRSGIRTVVEEPKVNRNLARLDEQGVKAVKTARRTVATKYGKKLKRGRGEYLERSFTHVLDNGDLRKATLKGQPNLYKRAVIAAMCCNVSLLMRNIFGVGTPKQALAGALLALTNLIYNLRNELFIQASPNNQFKTQPEENHNFDWNSLLLVQA